MHCRDEAATICLATTLVSSRSLNKEYTAWSSWLADWSSDPVARTCYSLYPSHEDDFDFWLFLAFFGLDGIEDFNWLLWRLVSGSYLKTLITSDDWFSFKTLDNFLTHQYEELFLIVIQQSEHHFWADFPHVLIFCDHLPHTVLFRVQLSCDHSNSQLTITTHHLPYQLDINLGPASWRSLAPGVIFHLLMTLFEFLVPLKIICAQHAVISINLLKHFKYLRRSFPQPKITLLGVHCSSLSIWKNTKVPESWEYSYILPRYHFRG